MNDRIRRHWRDLVQSDLTWVPQADSERPVRGVTRGVWVKANEDETQGFLKPTVPATAYCAAYEKIAADLACEIGVNVPPVVLYERPDARTGADRFVAISMAPDGPCWGFREPPDPIPAPVRASLQAALRSGCGGIALDAWLGNRNRSNPDNMLFALQEEEPVFYLDFSNSMDAAGTWSRGDFGHFEPLRLPFLLFDALCRNEVEFVTTRIQSLKEGVVTGIVERIPDNFMPASARRRTSEWLVWRKERVCTNIENWYPARRG